MRYKDIKISEPTADDYKWLRLAKHVSEWSLDPSTQTGAVLVNQFNRVVSVDCNRLPDGLDPEILTDRETKLKHIIHCEKAAGNTAGNLTRGCKLYTWPFMSCSVCASHMSDLGITANIAPYSDNERWLNDFDMAVQTYTKLGIEVKLIDISGIV
jgi:dCMP deaminase